MTMTETVMSLTTGSLPEPVTRDGPRVTILGTGTMGSAMARNLLRAGLPVTVWNRTPAPAARLTQIGASTAATPADAVASADVVITMLPDAAVVQEMLLGQGVLAALRTGAVLVQMGTIGVHATQELAAAVGASRPDVALVDAPVSGSRGPAEAGQLLVLASGPDRVHRQLQPVFSAIGRAAIWLGPTGAGSRLKLVLNTWLGFLIEGAAETAALADALGVDHKALIDSLDGGPLAAALALAKLRKIDSGDDSPEFSLRWAQKDLGLAVGEAGSRTLPVANAISRRWQELIADGLGELDVSAARHGLDMPAADGRQVDHLALTE